jgi:hypothetical protein
LRERGARGGYPKCHLISHGGGEGLAKCHVTSLVKVIKSPGHVTQEGGGETTQNDTAGWGKCQVFF